MADVVPSSEQAVGLLQNLSLDSNVKTQDPPVVSKKNTGENTKDDLNKTKPLSNRSAMFKPPNYIAQYPQYYRNGHGPSPTNYYGGFEGYNNWATYGRYNTNRGHNMPHGGVYGDMYNNGFGYGPYSPYRPAMVMPMAGQDCRMYVPQHYHIPGQFYPPPNNSAQTPTESPTLKAEVPISLVANESSTLDGTNNENSNEPVKEKTDGSKDSKPTENGNTNDTPISSGPILPGKPSANFDGVRAPVKCAAGSFVHDKHHKECSKKSLSTTGSHASNISYIKNQNICPQSPFMGLPYPRPASGMSTAVPGFVNRFHPNNRFYSQYCNTLRPGMGFWPRSFDLKANGNKKPMHGNGYCGYEDINIEGLNELNRGPRSGFFKSIRDTAPCNDGTEKEQKLLSTEKNESSCDVPDKDQYNHPEFPVTYSAAKFFIIKSYSEDDIHKSIKYNVWASTPNGNKKLDEAFGEAQSKTGECPVFLFFSVNTSGQFVGVAEMIGPVDFDKTIDYWQQDKWNGCFPVKWHIVKDVPNSLLKHITLENNENKPVTNSRDTQEIRLEPGLQMLKLFKDHVNKTSILEDFEFYNVRQKRMRERRIKLQFQKQVWAGNAAKAAERKDDASFKTTLEKPSHPTAVSTNETGESDSDLRSAI